MPRRFKSAFIIYSSMRHSQIKKELASKGSAKKVSAKTRKVVRTRILG